MTDKPKYQTAWEHYECAEDARGEPLYHDHNRIRALEAYVEWLECLAIGSPYDCGESGVALDIAAKRRELGLE